MECSIAWAYRFSARNTSFLGYSSSERMTARRNFSKVISWKPKHDLDDAEDFDDLTGEDEETVNEDDLEPAPRHIPRDEPEEPDYPEGYGYEEPEEDE